MENIVRVVTQDRVYQLGNHLPVPEGHQVEPFLIVDINWYVEDDVFECICLPDEEAANEPNPEPDMQSYCLLAKAALSDSLALKAIVTKNYRIETILTRADLEAQEAEEASDEDGDGDEKPQTPNTEASLEALPPEVSVDPAKP
jgi:hypothetical protein